MRRIYSLIFVMMILLLGCAATGSQETGKTAAKSESANVVSTSGETAENLSDMLGCNVTTAQSLCNSIVDITKKDITSFEQVPDDYETVLKVITVDNKEYYVIISKGYFISEVYEDSLEGKRVYRAIQ